jgi:dihydrofolate synthase/folylpolyglutamate synthase
LGNPQKNLKFIHVAGTNGKGSTCTMLSYILKEAGYKTGLFISPYLVDFRERIQINNEMIKKEDLANSVFCVKSAVERMVKDGKNHPTEFEIVTASAMFYFNSQNTDIVVLEVGMGGRLDATNVIKNPIATIITSISMDHKEHLGDTLEKIAFEKASIIKYGCPVIVSPQKDSVLNVIRQVAINNLSRLHIIDKNQIEIKEFGAYGQKLRYIDKSSSLGISDFQLNLIGNHQSLNVLTVLKTIEILSKKGYKISSQNIKEGLKKVTFPGRLEILSNSPFVIIDGAHNEEGLTMLYQNIKSYFPDHNIHLFFGMLADKDLYDSLKPLVFLCKSITTLTPNNPRAQKSSDTAKFIKSKIGTDININICNESSDSLNFIKKGENDINIYFGSLYMLGEIKGLFASLNN